MISYATHAGAHGEHTSTHHASTHINTWDMRHTWDKGHEAHQARAFYKAQNQKQHIEHAHGASTRASALSVQIKHVIKPATPSSKHVRHTNLKEQLHISGEGAQSFTKHFCQKVLLRGSIVNTTKYD